MTTPQFDSTLYCVHCSDDIDIPLSTIDGREDYWVYDGQEFRCKSCGGINRVICDVETSAEFVTCEEPGCVACGLRGADDAPEETDPAGHSPMAMWADLAATPRRDLPDWYVERTKDWPPDHPKPPPFDVAPWKDMGGGTWVRGCFARSIVNAAEVTVVDRRRVVIHVYRPDGTALPPAYALDPDSARVLADVLLKGAGWPV